MPGIVEEISDCVSVERVKGSNIFVRFENGHQLTVDVARGRTISEIDLVKGDHAELITAVGNKHDIQKIQPFDTPRQFDGQITYSDHKQFAVIDDKIVIYDKCAIKSFKIGERVHGLFVQGDYHHDNHLFVKRAIQIQSKKAMSPSSHGMRFKNAVPYLDMQYDIPCELYETITSNNVRAIMGILDEYVPRQELTMANIAENFHTLVSTY